mgnify:FL=1
MSLNITLECMSSCADNTARAIVVETGATPPLDFFPWLKRLPNFLSPWRKKAQHVRELELKVRVHPSSPLVPG